MAAHAAGHRTTGRDSLRQLFSAEQIMGMPARAPDRPWTEEEFYAARDAASFGERWEFIDGEVLVTPGPHWVHQRIIARLLILLDAYVRPRAFGEVFASPLDVKLRPGLVLQPDLLVVPSGELRRRSDIVQRLVLAAEIVSPSSARFDRVKKRPQYQRSRVSEYWIVDDMSQTIERWTPDDERPEILSERLTWHPAGVAEPFVLDLVEFFKDVATEDE
jgi:Uma2 family endonuclease